MDLEFFAGFYHFTFFWGATLPRRPKINAEVVRKLLIEAGHRCSVCGAGCPLEKAHIVPWHKSKEHRIEDLICLCASCHARADLEHWGEKALREYKRRPWILRQGSEAQKVPRPVSVQITLDLNLEQFDETDQRLFLYAIAAFLNIPPSAIKISNIRPSNSLDVTVRLGVDDANNLLTAYRNGDTVLMAYVAPFNVLRMELETQRDRSNTQQRIEALRRRFRSEFVGIGEAAEFLKVAPNTVRRWIRGGVLHAIKVGVRRRWLIRLDQLDAFTRMWGINEKRPTAKKRASRKRSSKKKKSQRS